MRFYLGHRVGGFWAGIGVGRYGWRRQRVVRIVQPTQVRFVRVKQASPTTAAVLVGLVTVAVLLYYWYVTVPLALLVALIWWARKR